MNDNSINIKNSFFTPLNLTDDKFISSKSAGVSKLISLIEKYLNKTDQKSSEIGEIKITATSIKYVSLGLGQAYELEISKKDKVQLKKISAVSSEIILKKDLVGEKIAEIMKTSQSKSLYLFSSGGGGHKSAKDAKLEYNLTIALDQVRKEFKENDHLLTDKRLTQPTEFISYCKKMQFVKEIDVLHDYLGSIGKWSSKQWDNAQISGETVKQEKLASKQWLSDLVFGPVVFFCTLKTLIQTQPQSVISTQAMATPSILLAIQIYNKFYKPAGIEDIKLHLYMTDMPTEQSGHFFDSLKKLKAIGGKDHTVLHAPQVANGTDWKVLCNLPNGQVKELKTNELPVRPAFLEAATSYQSSDAVGIKIGSQKEFSLLKEVLDYQGASSNLVELPPASHVIQKATSLSYQMQPTDEGYFLMLGSQPTEKAITDYVNQFIEQSKANPSKTYHLFAFTGKFDQKNDCFYKKISKYIKSQPNWPSNLRIVPLAFQDPAQLVSFELRCNTITRSGGASIMELLVLEEVRNKFDLTARKRFIHAQQVKGRNLETSIPLWERGNYLFLKNTLKDERVAAIAPNELKI